MLYVVYNEYSAAYSEHSIHTIKSYSTIYK